MRPEEFIDYAERLVVQPVMVPPQARSITSRAYYGAYHLAARFIAGLTSLKRGRHDAHVWLLASQHPDAHEAGKLLGILNSHRVKADYSLEHALSELPVTAKVAVELARDIQRLLQNCESAAKAEILARRRT
jgi:hypothetical protein